MQEQGVRHDDPEYIKAHGLLSAVQRQQAFQKQRQLAQQQQQLQNQRLQLAQQQQQQQQQQSQPQSQSQQPNGIPNDNLANGVDGMNYLVGSSHFTPNVGLLLTSFVFLH